MKEVVLFDRRRRGKKQAGAENASRKWRKKKKNTGSQSEQGNSMDV